MILKTADKDDGQAKAMDVIMSLEKGLPMIKSHIGGQGTADMELEPAQASYAADFDPQGDVTEGMFDDELPPPAFVTEPDFEDIDVLGEDEPVEPADDFLADVDAA
jgi:hypothetical protein